MPSARDEARAHRWLAEALERHRGDTGAWKRAGAMLAVQRRLVDRAYGNRTAFSKATGLNYRLTYDLEVAAGKKPERTNFTLDKILEAADAYGVQPLSIGLALDGGELAGTGEPPAAIPSPVEAVHSAAPDIPDIRVVAAGLMSEEDVRAAEPFYDIIMALVAGTSEKTGRPDPAGEEIFGPGDEAASWDNPRHKVWPPAKRALLLADVRAKLAAREGIRSRRHGIALDPGGNTGGAA